jgi:GntR family transcriptional regulator, vanillate catabolism transcriptional regulator
MRSTLSFQDASANQTLRALLGLRELVLAGELAPGERIAELNMVELLGVSRTPVRAALQRLHEEGLLEALPTGGYAVRGFSASQVRDAIEIRGTLEGLAARMAAERGVSQAQLDSAQTILEQIDGIVALQRLNDKRFARYITLNAQFHNLLLEMANSEPLTRELTRVVQMPFAGPNAFVQVQGHGPQALGVLILAQAQHRGVIEAIAQRESTRAEALMREHARIAHRNLGTALQQHRQLRQVPGGTLIQA